MAYYTHCDNFNVIHLIRFNVNFEPYKCFPSTSQYINYWGVIHNIELTMEFYTL